MNNKNYNYQYLIIFFFILIVIFFIYYNIKFNNNIENFHTYFNPFISNNSNNNEKLELLYNTNLYQTGYFRNNFIFDTLKFGHSPTDIFIKNNIRKNYDITFFDNLTKILLSNSNFINIENVKYKHVNDLIIDLNRNVVNFGLISTPILADIMINNNNNNNNNNNTLLINGDNIRFLFNTNQQYLLIITKIDRNISSLIDINNNTKIGIDYLGSSDYKVTNQLLNSFNKKKDIDYNLYYFQNNFNLLNALIHNKIDIIFLTISFPMKNLTYFFENNFYKDLIILSLDNLNFKKFFNQYYYYNKSYIDLNKVSDNYLPVKINNRLYSKFNPYLLTISFQNVFISNKFVKNNHVYKVIETYFNNINNLNKLDEFKQNKLDNFSSASLYNIQLKLHPSAEKYYLDNGYLTFNDNKNCKFFIGKMKCNNENLYRHNLLI